MKMIFAAVNKIRIDNFENGKINKKDFTQNLAEADRIELEQIDRAVSVLIENDSDEESSYYSIFGGEILAGSDGEALIVEPFLFETADDGSFEVCDPAVYLTNDEVKDAASVLEELSEKTFRAAYDLKMKKLTKWSLFSKEKRELKENADDIYEMFWQEMTALKSFYKKAGEAGNFIVIFPMYDEEDYYDYE